MRLLWILCLLVGSITCQPVQDSGPAAGGEPNPRGFLGPWVRGPGSPDPTVPYKPSKPDQQVGYVHGGYPGVHFPQNPHQTPDEPFFTDVSGLDPVYNFQSGSRYRRGRAHFSQTRYVPTDSLYGSYGYPDYLPPHGYYPPKGDHVPVKAY